VVDARTVLRISEESLVECNDMVSIDDLNEGVILHNLARRFEKGSIYTWIGSVIAAVNPVNAMPHLYGSDMMCSASTAAASDKAANPHIYVCVCKY
jgi:myosin heavy subunit